LDSRHYLDLELPSDRAKLTDAELYLSQHPERLVILDEIHRLPGIFETLRSLIDQRRRKDKRNCHFLLLGSATIDLLQQSAETLAGRIAYEELTPFSVSEVAEAGVGSAARRVCRRDPLPRRLDGICGMGPGLAMGTGVRTS
jgi:predicted AAA+ superfamily ATPase